MFFSSFCFLLKTIIVYKLRYWDLCNNGRVVVLLRFCFCNFALQIKILLRAQGGRRSATYYCTGWFFRVPASSQFFSWWYDAQLDFAFFLGTWRKVVVCMMTMLRYNFFLGMIIIRIRARGGERVVLCVYLCLFPYSFLLRDFCVCPNK